MGDASLGRPGFDEDLEDLFENAPCGYVSARADGRITKVNRTLATWLGYDAQALVGRRFQELLNIAGKIYYETHFAPLLRMQGFFSEVALDLVGEGGRVLPVLVNAIERRDAAGDVRFIRITIFNASDRRRYERELLEARRTAEAASRELRELNLGLEARIAEAVDQRLRVEEALRQSQKMEAIGQLTGGVAHDFNNLLTVMIGGLETIERQAAALAPSESADRIRRALAMALHGAERAATLTARLLAFSRRQPLNPKSLDVNRLVSNLTEMLQRTLGETVTLETSEGAGLWRVLADPGELENALVNLAVNARDAMPNGGRLTIETRNAVLDEAYVGSFAEPISPGRYVLIAVADTGTGMDAETLARVFEPFFTTKGAGKGTGLGLSQVYGFVRQSGGHVRICSELGAGATVQLYLPVATGDHARAEDTEDRARGPVRGGGETVLVVEDHDEVRAYSSEVLSELGYRVLEAPHGPAALALLDGGAQVDLLFADVVLPEGMDGRQLADAAARRNPAIKVLFTTGYTRDAIVRDGRLETGVQLISKPFNATELGAKVRQVLDG